MGLLDDVLSRGGLSQGGGAQVLGMLEQALASHGGVQGLVTAFQQGGLGHVISSWIGTGENLPVAPGQLTQVLGGDQLSQIAAQLGLPADGAAGKLAEVLPGLIDRATPDGKLPAAGESPLGGLIGGLFGS